MRTLKDTDWEKDAYNGKATELATHRFFVY